MPPVINSLKGGHMHTDMFAHRSNSKKPGVRRPAAGVRVVSKLHS